MSFHVYILYSKARNLFYVGQTSDLLKRLAQHNNGKSKYTSTGIPWRLLWSARKPSRRAAEDLESKLKNLSRVRKIRFMEKYSEGIKDHELLSGIRP